MRFAKLLQIEDKELEDMRLKAKEKIKKAVEFAEACPEPDVATIMEGVYA